MPEARIARIGELLDLRMKDIDLTGKIGHITVNGKTGERKIPIILSVKYLSQYIQHHDDKACVPAMKQLSNAIRKYY